MSAAELKAKWEALQAELEKSPDNAELKSQVDAAKAAYEAKAAQEAEFDPEKADEKTKAYIASLRKENAKYRTEAKDAKSKLETVTKALGGGGDQESPEQKAQRLAAEREQIAFDNAVLANAVEFGVPKEGMKYFKYLLAEAAQELPDGEELSAEKIAEFARDAKAKSVKQNATTTVTQTAGSGQPPASGSDPALKVEDFAKMTITQKSDLWTKNPQQYEQLMAAAMAKGLIK